MGGFMQNKKKKRKKKVDVYSAAHKYSKNEWIP